MEQYSEGERWWQALRDYQLRIFNTDKSLWRLSVPSTSQIELPDNDYLIDWGGAQYWVLTEKTPDQMFSMAEKAGGSATLFRGGDHNGEVFHPLSSEIYKLHVGLKKAFDPHGILNPGKMYTSI